jgi:hypothetical protein
MLNELYELAVALDHHGLLQSTTHPSIGTVGKSMCMLIELDRSGTDLYGKIGKDAYIRPHSDGRSV